MDINYGSVTSGIEAATVAWHGLGWRPQWFSEIEKFPCRLLKHHYPHVPNLGDMLKIETNEIFKSLPIDLLVGGTPCQSFSLAGLRGGLADVRGNLALEFCRILDRKRPRWFVWENVPGVFSSYSNEAGRPVLSGIGPDNGRDITETADFAALLNAFSKCGYSCAWRVLDSQYFGVPQRRRRVFVVGYIGNDWRPPFAVLFERESMRGNFTPGGKTEEDIAGTITAGARKSDRGENGNLVLPPLHASWWDGGQTAQTLDAVLQKGQTMPEKNRFPAVLQPLTRVRRLTPLECERLQGFPDHYTAIPGAKDGPRYKALGNSMTINVMRWIGQRIDKVDKIFTK